MNEGILKNTQMRILLSLAVLMAIIAMASYATLNFHKVDFLNPTPATIAVSGEGEVLAKPDVGKFSFSVKAESDDATMAIEESGTKINEIIDYLKEKGIEERDIKNQSYNLYPKYKWEDKICPVGSYCPRERVEDGYEVNQTIQVKVRDTQQAGEIIAGVGERGATNISGLDFVIDDTDAVREEARDKAIADAKEKAERLAEQLGVQIIRLVSYYEDGGNYFEPYKMDVRAMSMDVAEESAFGGAAMPVGEESTTVRVNVTFEVK